ncbi:hypothetical protein J6590_014077 [Homalodisca vitripennis]|nr:hypothetical protein J6590_014077 [Homalodisca vitripennis]
MRKYRVHTFYGHQTVKESEAEESRLDGIPRSTQMKRARLERPRTRRNVQLLAVKWNSGYGFHVNVAIVSTATAPKRFLFCHCCNIKVTLSADAIVVGSPGSPGPY